MGLGKRRLIVERAGRLESRLLARGWTVAIDYGAGELVVGHPERGGAEVASIDLLGWVLRFPRDLDRQCYGAGLVLTMRLAEPDRGVEVTS